MQYGVCLLSVVPCRREPAGTSEMVTQLLFGELYEVLEPGEDWLKIRTAADSYECWLSAKQHASVSRQAFQDLRAHRMLFAQDLVQVVHNKLLRTTFPITIGAALPGYKDHLLSFDDYLFSYEGAATSGKKGSASDLVSTSFLFLNAPYQWGGRSPFGIDCSGFTQLVFRLNGIMLPRDAWQQAALGESLSFVEEAQAGDLAFFDNEDGRIVHVGLLIGGGQIIHASGSVRIDRLDHYGIHHSTLKRYTHNLRVIKRLV